MHNKVETNLKLDFNDVLIKPCTSSIDSRQHVNLNCNYEFKYGKYSWIGIPILSSNMHHTGTLNMATAINKLGLGVCFSKYCDPENLIDFLVHDKTKLNFYTTGIQDIDYENLLHCADTVTPQYILVDVANGYMTRFLRFITKVRNKFPESVIAAGNVATAEGTRDIIEAGADIVKVSIGCGSCCTTRIMTGVGYPAISCLLECSEVARDMDGYIINDGGCVRVGDVCKAFAAGADFCMTGYLFSGHKECEGHIVESPDGEKKILFFGMSSKEAHTKFNGGLGKYRAAEGKASYIPFKSNIDDTVQKILGGLRSTCSYVGAENLSDLYDKAVFIRTNVQENTILN